MISGAHMIVFSRRAERDRRFLRDVLRLPYVDAGDGWLIFALPPSELAVHPSSENGRHVLMLTCDDLAATIRALGRKRIRCTRPVEQEWGTLTEITLPGGGRLKLYQPKHPRPHARGTPRNRRGRPARSVDPVPRRRKRSGRKGPSSRRAG